MKKGTIVFLSAMLIVIFTSGIAYLCFILYDKGEDRFINSVEISIEDKGKGIDIGSLYPCTDNQAKELKPYKFQIANTGSSDTEYKILIEEVELSDKEGYSKKDLLSRSQLRYELILNDKVIARDDMDKIKNNILDERTVVKSKTNKYQLRVWIAESAGKTKWTNKYYHYKVNIQPVTKGE